MEKLTAFIIITAFLALFIAGFQYCNFDEPYLSDDTDLFDYSSQPLTDWNENTHEMNFKQKISSVDNSNIENISIDVLFYKNNKLLGVESSDLENIENSTFDLDFTVKLDSEPDMFLYNVTDMCWA